MGGVGVQARLDKILGREKWHRSGPSWISGAIYGANDGLAAVFGIVAGVAGATSGSSAVLTAGLAGAIASALSMATGAFLAERSEAEVAAATLERERQEITAHPEEEKEELSLFYQLKGVDEATADLLAEQLSKNPDAMLQALAAEELGITGTGGSDPVQAAIAAGISTGLGAIIPVIPFMITTGTPAIIAAAIVSLVAHFLVGAAKSLVTLRSWWAAGLEMTPSPGDRRRRPLHHRTGPAQLRDGSVEQVGELGAEVGDLGLERRHACLERATVVAGGRHPGHGGRLVIAARRLFVGARRLRVALPRDRLIEAAGGDRLLV
ncbi:MAG: VIT1/CCC1 transporter family protein [Solirubrobacteraceae bacterium]